MRILLPALVFVGIACRPTHTDTRAPSGDVGIRFQTEVDRLRREYALPGLNAAFIQRDGSISVAVSGLADVERRTPMTPRSRMLAASIGKTFVAATALALTSEGRLDLDGRLASWLSDRPWLSRLANHDSITLRQLLTHTAGLPDHVHTAEFARDMARGWREPGRPFPPEALVGYVLDRPALFPAGQGWSYSDTGYILAGLIIERVAQRTYYDEVRRRFTDRLDLTATNPSDRHALPGLAAGYMSAKNPLGLPVKTTRAPGVMAWNPAVEWTGGGLVSTPRDLVVWARALFEGRAMSGPYLKELLRSVPVDSRDSGVRYGAGVAVYSRTPYGPIYGHGGTIPGYTSSLRYYPYHRVAVAFQINADTGLIRGGTSTLTDIEHRLVSVVIGR